MREWKYKCNGTLIGYDFYDQDDKGMRVFLGRKSDCGNRCKSVGSNPCGRPVLNKVAIFFHSRLSKAQIIRLLI